MLRYIHAMQVLSFKIAAAIVLLFAMTACTGKKEAPRQRPPAPVTVVQAEQKDMPLQLKSIGNVEAYNTVGIKSLVNGTVDKVHFREGQDVQKGQLLFTIDPRPFQAALRQAEANLAKDVAQARNAEEQARRYAGLVKDGIVTQEQYDQLKTTADSYGANVAADRAAVESAKLQLSYCYIHSPLAGRTGNLAVNAGNVVKANDVPILVTINQVSPIYVSFTVPERELAGLKKHIAAGDLKVEAVVPSDGQQADSGSISFLDNTVDPATGTIRLKGTFANLKRHLWPGQFVNVILTLATKPKAVVVPTTAVQTGQQGQYVFVVGADLSAEVRPVVTGITSGGLMVIEQGLKAGETVVTDGQLRLTPGAKVVISKPGDGQTPESGQKAIPSPAAAQGGGVAQKPAAATPPTTEKVK
jgi:membrane fusion protein, multidrug efflux system